MTGTITVQSADVPPTVIISNPTNGSVFAAPATLNLTATASDSDGSVTNVQFFQGTTSLGSVANSPYSVTVRDLPMREHIDVPVREQLIVELYSK